MGGHGWSNYRRGGRNGGRKGRDPPHQRSPPANVAPILYVQQKTHSRCDNFAVCSAKYSHSPYTIRYDTRCYFNLRSKADMSQLNLPHGNRQLKSVKTEKKLKVENRYAQK